MLVSSTNVHYYAIAPNKISYCLITYATKDRVQIIIVCWYIPTTGSS